MLDKKELINLIKSNLYTYPCPLNMSNLYNYGFITGVYIILQIITGIIISCRYVSDSGFESLDFIMKSVNDGNIMRYMHSNGASYVFIVLLIHMGRSMYYNSKHHTSTAWNIGIIIYLLSIVICFFGYVLPWGQMSYWAATVITNLTGIVPGLQKLLLGSYIVDKYTCERFFVFHFILPFVILILLVIHILYLHNTGSTNPRKVSNVLQVSFYPLMLYSDLRLLNYIMLLTILNVGLGFIEFSHPDNSVEVNAFKTPLQIVPEWYFLAYYEILKIIPNKIGGLLTLCAIFIMIFSVENKDLNKHSLDNFLNKIIWIFIFFFLLSYLGACLPLPIYNYYGSISTLCIIFLLAL